MRDDEVFLERILAGLRESEPSPGLESRILSRIDAHQVRRIHWWWPVLALACTLIAAFLFHGLLARDLPKLPPQITTVATKAPGPESLPVTRIVVRTRQQRPQPHHSAPPFPLTEQEKLLLRLARRPDDAIILNPDVRAAQSASARAQFQHFFQMDDAEMRSQLE